MGCPTCHKDQVSKVHLRTFAAPYPFKAQDIQVIEDGEHRPFAPEDWPADKHVLLVLIPQAFTPVCTTELGAMNRWFDAFQELGCELIAVCADPVTELLAWQVTEPLLAAPRYKTFSSYQLPAQLGMVEEGRAKRASVFVTAEGKVVRQEHFDQVGRSFEELHRQLWAYTTGNYCGEGWKSPADSLEESEG